MYKRIQQWFIDTFPDAEHTLNTDSAVPAVTAWYFSVSVEDNSWFRLSLQTNIYTLGIILFSFSYT